MHRSWLARATVLLLIAGILGGGSGAPVIDALLYHTKPDRGRCEGAHFEPQGIRHAHADKCTLGQLLRVQPSASNTGEPALVTAQLVSAVHMGQAAPARAARFYSSLHSRAPPTRSA